MPTVAIFKQYLTLRKWLLLCEQDSEAFLNIICAAELKLLALLIRNRSRITQVTLINLLLVRFVHNPMLKCLTVSFFTMERIPSRRLVRLIFNNAAVIHILFG